MSVIASASKAIKFHQWPEGFLQQSYMPKSHEGYVQSLSWGKDGSWVVLVPDSGPTEIISIKESTKLLQTIQDVYHPTCASFHTMTKKLIGIGTVCGQVMIYDIKSKSIKKRFPRASSKILSLCYNCKDTHIAATCSNGEILLLSNLTGNISTKYKVPNSSSVSCTNFHRSKRSLFAAGSDVGIVATWDINSNQMLYTTQAHQSSISSLVFSPLRVDLLVTGGLDRKFSFYDLSVCKPVIDVEVPNAVMSMDFSHCGVYLGIGFQNGNIAIYDTRRTLSSPLSIFEAHAGSGIRHLLFQKVLTNSMQNNSVFDITIPDTFNVEQNDGDHSLNNVGAFDSLGTLGCDNSKSQSINEETAAAAIKCSQEYSDDSFLIALGLDGKSLTTSIQNESNAAYKLNEECKKLSDSSKQHRTLYFNRSRQYGNFPPTKAVQMKTSSTPNVFDVEVPDSVESPIVARNQTCDITHQATNTNAQCVSVDNLQVSIRDVVRQEVRDIIQQEVRGIVRQEVREVIREELSNQTDLLKSAIKTHFTDIEWQVRRHVLDLQMSIVKEFVNMESLLQNHTQPSEFVCNGLVLNQNVVQQERIKENVIERDEYHSRKF